MQKKLMTRFFFQKKKQPCHILVYGKIISCKKPRKPTEGKTTDGRSDGNKDKLDQFHAFFSKYERIRWATANMFTLENFTNP